MKKIIILFLILFAAGFFYFGWKNYGNLLSLIVSKPAPVADGDLKVPSGFKIEVFARDLPDARVMKQDTFGNLWVSQPDKGQVSLIEIQDGKAVRSGGVFRDLNRPHGLAFHPQFPFRLYIAEEDKVISVPTYSEPDTIKIADLPAGGNHRSRTIGFGPDDRLYVSVGSTCNVCQETDERRAVILRSEVGEGDLKVWARGLRNTVFFAWNDDSRMFGTDMSRDFLGDDLPPDEINIIEGPSTSSGYKNYGWPICYGQNIHDTDFDKNVYFRNPCMEPFEQGSYIDIPAHSAPLGLAFIPKNSSWPTDYWGDLLVAYHGSWNRSVPTGYKVVRYEFDNKGEYTGKVFDFITGFLTESGEVLGRPVDILISPKGFAYISDDYVGVIYKIEYVD